MSASRARARRRPTTARARQYLPARGHAGRRGLPARRGAGIADFPAAHPLWSRRRAPAVARHSTTRRSATGWTASLAIGHGTPIRWRSAEAIAMPPRRSRSAADRQHSRTTTAFAAGRPVDDHADGASAGPARARRRPRAHHSTLAAPTRAPARCTCTSRASATTSTPSRRTADMKLQGQDRRSHRRRLGLRPRMRAHRRGARHEPRAGRRAAGRARRGRGRDRGAGAQVLRAEVDVSKAAQMEALGRGGAAALRRAALRLQQRRRRRRRAGVGEHASPTGSGCSAST